MLIINLRTARGETEHPREIDILARSVEFLPWAHQITFVDEFGRHDSIVYGPETTKFAWAGEIYDFCTTYPLEEVDRAWGVYDTKSERWVTTSFSAPLPALYGERRAKEVADGESYIARELVIAALPLGEPYDR